MAVKGSVSEVL